jgi:DNA-binding PadR family transcriptional regulator
MDRAVATQELLRAVGYEITPEGRERLRNHLAPLGASRSEVRP